MLRIDFVESVGLGLYLIEHVLYGEHESWIKMAEESDAHNTPGTCVKVFHSLQDP